MPSRRAGRAKISRDQAFGDLDDRILGIKNLERQIAERIADELGDGDTVPCAPTIVYPRQSLFRRLAPKA